MSVSTHRTSVGVRQHTQDFRGCPCVSVSTHRTSVAVHQYTYMHVGPWTQHTDLPVECSGDFRPRGLSVQYTQDVHGCPSANTGRLCVSVSTHMTSVAVCVCPCVSVSTHSSSVAVHQSYISTLVLGLITLTLPVDCSGDFGQCGLSVLYT